jgi:hypothetical protein
VPIARSLPCSRIDVTLPSLRFLRRMRLAAARLSSDGQARLHRRTRRTRHPARTNDDCPVHSTYRFCARICVPSLRCSALCCCCLACLAGRLGGFSTISQPQRAGPKAERTTQTATHRAHQHMQRHRAQAIWARRHAQRSEIALIGHAQRNMKRLGWSLWNNSIIN